MIGAVTRSCRSYSRLSCVISGSTQCCDQALDRSWPAVGLQAVSPAEVICQVLAGDAIETCQPGMEPAVIAVHVFYVNRAARPDAGAQIDCFMPDAALACESAVGGRPVGHQQHIRSKHWIKMAVQLARAHRPTPTDKIPCVPAAVARDQNAIEFSGNATTFRLAATMPRRPGEMAAAFLRFEKVSFVRLDDAMQRQWPVMFCLGEKPVAPAETRIAMDARFLGGRPHWL